MKTMQILAILALTFSGLHVVRAAQTFPVKLTVTDQTKGKITGGGSYNEENGICWLGESLAAASGAPGTCYMYAADMSNAVGQLVKNEDDWTWTVTINVPEGTGYTWCPGVINAGNGQWWQPVSNIYEYVGDVGNNLLFSVESDGKITGNTDLTIESTDKKITFNIDVTRAVESGILNPGSDIVQIVGFNDGWNGKNMSRVGESNIYTITMTETVVEGNHTYKFRVGTSWDYLEGKPYEEAAIDQNAFNRTVTITSEKIYTIDCVWDELYHNSVASINELGEISAPKGVLFEDLQTLPSTVNVNLGVPNLLSGQTIDFPVIWDKGDFDETKEIGTTFTVTGTLDLTGSISTFSITPVYYNYFNVQPSIDITLATPTGMKEAIHHASACYDRALGQIIVRSEEAVQSVDVVTVSGIKIKSYANVNGGLNIDMQGYPSGIYLVIIDNSNVVKITK